MKQQSLASLTYEGMKKRTKREKFLNEMARVVPWERLEKLVEPYYPKVGKGRPPKGLWVIPKGHKCCGYIACNNGTGCPTRGLERRCTTWSR